MLDILIKNIIINIFHVSSAVIWRIRNLHLTIWLSIICIAGKNPPAFVSLKHSFLRIYLVCYMLIGDVTLSSRRAGHA